MSTIIRSKQGIKKWCEERGINFGHGKDVRPSIVRSFLQYPYHLADKISEYTYEIEGRQPFNRNISVNDALNSIENTDELISWIEYMQLAGLKQQR